MKKTFLSLIAFFMIQISFSHSVFASSYYSLDFIAGPVNKRMTYFVIQAASSSKTYPETLVIQNPNNYTIDVNASTENSYTGINGNLSYTLHPKKNWIQNLPSQIEVPPKTSKNVNFLVNVPKGVTPGEYDFGIVLKDHPPTSMVSSSAHGVSFGYKSQIQQIIAVDVQMQGKQETDVQLTNAGLNIVNYQSSFVVQGVNKSNMIVRHVFGNIVLYHNHHKIFSTSIVNVSLDSFLPFEFSYHWKGLPAVGQYKAVVTIKQIEKTLQQKTFYFSIDQKEIRTIASEIPGVSKYAYIPWWMYGVIGLFLVLISVLAFWIMKIRSSKKDE